MWDTAFYVVPDKVDRFAACYGPRKSGGLRMSDNPRESQFLKKPGLLSGGGGLLMTMGDYLRFCRMLLNRGELDGQRLLRTETVEMMKEQHRLPSPLSSDLRPPFCKLPHLPTVPVCNAHGPQGSNEQADGHCPIASEQTIADA